MLFYVVITVVAVLADLTLIQWLFNRHVHISAIGLKHCPLHIHTVKQKLVQVRVAYIVYRATLLRFHLTPNSQM